MPPSDLSPGWTVFAFVGFFLMGALIGWQV